jgi:polyhydroxybutyrate depolymerase
MQFTVRIFILLNLFVLASVVWTANAPADGSQTNQLLIDGVSRSYRVYCPKICQNEKLPLMIVLHGGLGNAEVIEKRTGMNEIADTGCFIVAYPNGTEGHYGMKNRRTWNAGTCCGIASKSNVDDVKFIEAVIEHLKELYPVDSSRVYAAGMSNGGMMAYRLATEIPNKIAAVAVVSATLAVDNFDPARNVAVLHIHGTDDQFVPIGGGKGKKSVSNVDHLSLADTIERVTKARNCLPPQVRMLGEGIELSTYQSKGAPVEVVVIKNGAHAWPGGKGRKDNHGLKEDFSASRYAWEFVRKFILKKTSSGES